MEQSLIMVKVTLTYTRDKLHKASIHTYACITGENCISLMNCTNVNVNFLILVTYLIEMGYAN